MVDQDAGQRKAAAVQSMLNGLDILDKKDIDMLKGFSNPPQLIQDILRALAIIIRHDEVIEKWLDAKKMVANSLHFIQKLREFDCN